MIPCGDFTGCRCVVAQWIDDQLSVLIITPGKRRNENRSSPDPPHLLHEALQIGLEISFGIGMKEREALLVIVPELDEIELSARLQGFRPRSFVDVAFRRAPVRGEIEALCRSRQICTEPRPPSSLKGYGRIPHQHHLDRRRGLAKPGRLLPE